jgi:hypothetical protein
MHDGFALADTLDAVVKQRRCRYRSGPELVRGVGGGKAIQV